MPRRTRRRRQGIPGVSAPATSTRRLDHSRDHPRTGHQSPPPHLVNRTSRSRSRDACRREATSGALRKGGASRASRHTRRTSDESTNPSTSTRRSSIWSARFASDTPRQGLFGALPGAGTCSARRNAPRTSRRGRRGDRPDEVTGRALEPFVTTQGHGNMFEGAPTPKGRGTGNGRRGASSGSHMISFSIRPTASLRRGSRTRYSSPSRQRRCRNLRPHARALSRSTRGTALGADFEGRAHRARCSLRARSWLNGTQHRIAGLRPGSSKDPPAVARPGAYLVECRPTDHASRRAPIQ